MSDHPTPPSAPPITVAQLMDRLEVLCDCIGCTHEDRTDGNDYLVCNVCYLMWDYRRESHRERLASDFRRFKTDLEAALRASPSAQERRMKALIAKWRKDSNRQGEWHGEDEGLEEGRMLGREECADELEAALSAPVPERQEEEGR